HCPLRQRSQRQDQFVPASVASGGSSKRPMGSPVITARSAARRENSCRRWASSSSTSCGSLPTFTLRDTVPIIRPITTSTTRISMSEKPRALIAAWPTPLLLVRQNLVQALPVAKVHVRAFATGDAVRAQGIDVELAVLTGAQIPIGIAPGISGYALHVLLPLLRHRIEGGALHQRLQALLAGGVDVVVELVDLQRRLDAIEVGKDGAGARHVGLADELRRNDAHEQSEDDQHHQQFDQAETAGFAALPGGCRF